ncbi:MAG: arginine deiminase family protein [Leptolyngbyaceae cyanobacterium bins.302]|nr:arginine deiminase family protein [Leptolyngbyaceae cyanobacterium bins.302]
MSFVSTTTEKIDVLQTSEIGQLKHVIWGAITPFEFTLKDIPELIDVSLIHQVLHNRNRFIDIERASQQHFAFKQVLESHGVIVHEVKILGDTFSQYGPRDIGFVIDHVFIPARARRNYRQRELVGIRPIVDRLSKVAYLDYGHLEGGDVMLHDGIVLVGLSEESDLDGVDALRHLLHQQNIEREVIPIRFSHRGITHLDSKFNIVAPNTALIYPPSFEPESLKFLEQRFDFIVATREEALDVQINVVSLGDGKVVVKSSSDRLINQLEQKGLTVIPVDYDEVTPLGGSFRCTTLPLVRQ